MTKIEAVVERHDIVERGDRDPGIADLAVDVRALIGIEPVESNGVEGRG